MARMTPLPPGLYYDSHKRCFCIDKWIRGKRLRKALPGLSRRKAEQVLAMHVAAVIEHRYFGSADSLTVRRMLEHYWLEHMRYEVQGDSHKFMLDRLERALGDTLAIEVTWNDVVAYMRTRMSQPTKYKKLPHPRTVIAELERLSMAYNHAVDGKVLRVDQLPFKRRWKAHLRRQFSRGSPRPAILDGARECGPQWQALYSASRDQWYGLAFWVIYESGMRAEESLALRSEWIRVEAVYDPGTNSMVEIGRIDLPGVEPIAIDDEEVERLRPITKTRHPRTIVIPARLARILLFRAGRDYVFERTPGVAFKYDALRSAFRRACTRAALALPGGSGPHTLRRTRASIDSKIDERASMSQLGHADQRTHSLYVVHGVERQAQLVLARGRPSPPKSPLLQP